MFPRDFILYIFSPFPFFLFLRIIWNGKFSFFFDYLISRLDSTLRISLLLMPDPHLVHIKQFFYLCINFGARPGLKKGIIEKAQYNENPREFSEIKNLKRLCWLFLLFLDIWKHLKQSTRRKWIGEREIGEYPITYLLIGLQTNFTRQRSCAGPNNFPVFFSSYFRFWKLMGF